MPNMVRKERSLCAQMALRTWPRLSTNRRIDQSTDARWTKFPSGPMFAYIVTPTVNGKLIALCDTDHAVYLCSTRGAARSHDLARTAISTEWSMSSDKHIKAKGGLPKWLKPGPALALLVFASNARVVFPGRLQERLYTSLCP